MRFVLMAVCALAVVHCTADDQEALVKRAKLVEARVEFLQAQAEAAQADALKKAHKEAGRQLRALAKKVER